MPHILVGLDVINLSSDLPLSPQSEVSEQIASDPNVSPERSIFFPLVYQEGKTESWGAKAFVLNNWKLRVVFPEMREACRRNRFHFIHEYKPLTKLSTNCLGSKRKGHVLTGTQIWKWYAFLPDYYIGVVVFFSELHIWRHIMSICPTLSSSMYLHSIHGFVDAP